MLILLESTDVENQKSFSSWQSRLSSETPLFLLGISESVTAASVKSKGTLLGRKKPVGARKALNDITNKSGIQAKVSSKNKQVASAAVKDEIDIDWAHRTPLCKSKRGNVKDTYPDDLLAPVLRVQ